MRPPHGQRRHILLVCLMRVLKGIFFLRREIKYLEREKVKRIFMYRYGLNKFNFMKIKRIALIEARCEINSRENLD
jgi:hypothetical protein